MVRFEGCAFKNSCHLKVIVNHFLDMLETKDHEVVPPGKVGGQKISFVDRVVYSRYILPHAAPPKGGVTSLFGAPNRGRM